MKFKHVATAVFANAVRYPRRQFTNGVPLFIAAMIVCTASVFASTGGPCPAAGSCFVEHDTPGCDDAECCAATCAVNPFCCEVAWDQACVNEAGLFCKPPDPPTAIDGVVWTPLGRASLTVDAGTGCLTVENLNDTGDDGALALLGGALGLDVRSDYLAGGELPIGATVTWRRSALSAGRIIPNASALTLLRTAEGYDITPDYSGVGATGAILRIRNAGELVYSTEAGSASFVTITIEVIDEGDFICVVITFTDDGGSQSCDYASFDNASVIHVDDGSGQIVTVMGDYWEFVPVGVTTSVDSLHDVSFTTTGYKALGICETALRLPGFNAQAIGQAQFDVAADNGLKVVNIGLSGEDGVVLAAVSDVVNNAADQVEPLAFAESFEGTWENLDPNDVVGAGATIQFSATGIIGGAPDTALGTLSITRLSEDSAVLTADYSSVGSTSQQVEVYNSGQLVTIVTGNTEPLSIARHGFQLLGKYQDPIKCKKGIAIIDGLQTSCFAPKWPEPHMFHFSNGLSVPGDELRVLAEDASGEFQGIQSFGIALNDYPEITITQAAFAGPTPCTADLTGDGVVGVFDLLVLLGCWGAVAPGCESADLTDDGTVGVVDLLALLGAWGECP